MQEAVFVAFEQLLARNPGQTPSLATIADVAGVNVTSLYRRWRTSEALALAVGINRLVTEHPIPDTGTLRGDLRIWAVHMADSLNKPQNSKLLKMMALNALEPLPTSNSLLPVAQRIDDIELAIERACQRGERFLSAETIADIMIAPIYLRALFVGGVKDVPLYVDTLLDRLFSLKDQTTPLPLNNDQTALLN